MLRFKETDATGKPIYKSSLENVIADLKSLSADVVTGLCAALITEHEPYNWRDIYWRLKKDLDKNDE